MERPHAVEFINALECDADLDQIQLILDAIDDIQYIAISGKHPLHYAAIRNRPDVIAYLINKLGCDIEILSEKSKATPLLAAITHRCEDSALKLLRLGANWKIKLEGQSLRRLAERNGLHKVAEVLRKKEFKQKKKELELREMILEREKIIREIDELKKQVELAQELEEKKRQLEKLKKKNELAKQIEKERIEAETLAVKLKKDEVKERAKLDRFAKKREELKESVATLSEEKYKEYEKLKPDVWDNVLRWPDPTVVAMVHEFGVSGDDIARKDAIVLKRQEQRSIKMRSKPFAKGGERAAILLAEIPVGGKTGEKKVAKSYLKIEDNLKNHFNAVRLHIIAKFFARSFNEKISGVIAKKIHFTKLDIYEVNGAFYAVEPWLTGEFRRFTYNHGYVFGESSMSVQSFIHFSWQESGEKFLVTDIQGIRRGSDYIFTDPAILSVTGLEFGPTDLGEKFIRQFFENHQCNKICEHLKLKFHLAQRNKVILNEMTTMIK